MNKQELNLILPEGEGQFLEFKERIDKNFARELVAFANSAGGRIFLGIKDSGAITGIKNDNRLKSQIQDTARNCNPQIVIDIQKYENIMGLHLN